MTLCRTLPVEEWLGEYIHTGMGRVTVKKKKKKEEKYQCIGILPKKYSCFRCQIIDSDSNCILYSNHCQWTIKFQCWLSIRKVSIRSKQVKCKPKSIKMNHYSSASTSPHWRLFIDKNEGCGLVFRPNAIFKREKSSFAMEWFQAIYVP